MSKGVGGFTQRGGAPANGEGGGAGGVHGHGVDLPLVALHGLQTLPAPALRCQPIDPPRTRRPAATTVPRQHDDLPGPQASFLGGTAGGLTRDGSTGAALLPSALWAKPGAVVVSTLSAMAC